MQDLPFAARTASKFCNQIRQLASARDQVPTGWHGIFDQALRSLKAVDCTKRDGIEISEIAFGCGSLHLEVYYAPVDKVVRGILNCLCKRSRSTCQECGRGYGAVYRNSSRSTLCARCHVHTDLSSELHGWFGENSANRAYRKRPIIEFDSLPTNIKLLIPKGQIKCLRLVAGDKEITYATTDDVMAHRKTLAVMKRFMDQSQLS